MSTSSPPSTSAPPPSAAKSSASGSARTPSPGFTSAPAAGAPARRAALTSAWTVRAGALLFGLAVWWTVTAVHLVPALYLPSPGSVWEAFVRANSTHPVADGVDRLTRGEQNYYLWEHLVASLQRIGIGVGAAVLLGIPAGLLLATVRAVGVVAEPYLNFLRSLPPLGYMGLLVVWFGIGDTSKIWLLFIAAFPPIALAVVSGVRGVREDQVNAVLSLGASRPQVVTRVLIPATMPEVLHGIRVAAGFAWTTVVAAELNNGIPGIGGLAYLAGTQLRTPLTVACILVIGIAAVALDGLLKLAETRLVPWRGKA